MTTTSAVRYDKDADNIVTLTLDDPTARANTMNDAYAAGMRTALDRLETEIAEGSVVGVLLASAKTTFFAGGNLKQLLKYGPGDAKEVYELSLGLKADLRRLERCGVPVVAAINGAALGGGYEICLAAHRRIAVDAPETRIGLPEVTLGLLPGAGGVVRTVRLLGLKPAILDVLTTGTRFTVKEALATGLIDDAVEHADELLPAARRWILANMDNAAAAVQPWDREDFSLPGGALTDPAVAQLLPSLPGVLRKRAKGAPYAAPLAIAAAAVEGAQVDFANAEKIESRYFTNLVTGQQAKAMIQASFFDLQLLKAGSAGPDGHAHDPIRKVAVLGAGMMGAGIAYSSAEAGIEVVLKDVSMEAAERGKAYSAKLLAKQLQREQISEETQGKILGRITPTVDLDALAACDLVIEAVFEDPALKRQVFQEVEGVIPDSAILGSNTSTLPITELADGVDRKDKFIGIHFFSPVDRMPIVEIIRGAVTSDDTLARTVDFVRQIGKVPIVVNDSRGFYTSRVIEFMVNEGMAMLAEGVAPWTIERATTQAGYPAPVLQLTDELNLELIAKIEKATADAAKRDGITHTPHPGSRVVTQMLEHGRAGRLRRGGFYEYDEAGNRTGLWRGLADLYPLTDMQIPIQDVKDRMMFAEALETAKCFEEGVVESAAGVNVASILAIGFPSVAGGAATFMTNYQGGLPGFVARARELAEKYGDRFAPTDWLVAKAESGTGAFPK